MFAQDPYSGYIHEAPEYAGSGYGGYAEPEYAGYGYYGEPAYDGFGNTFGYLGERGRRGRRRAPEPMPPPVPPQTPPAPDGGMPPEMGPEGGGQGIPGGAEEMGEVVYDGFGNPVGIFPGLNPFKAIGSAVRKVGSLVPSPLRGLVGGGGFPGIPLPHQLLASIANRIGAQRRLIQSYRMSGRPVPPAILQNLQGLLARYRGLRSGGFPGRGRTPWPLGWIRRPLPYTGLGPRRIYMRCAVWPGPRGLVPAHAATMQAAVAAQQAAAMGGRRGRRRRRR
jgi:hypothetical protein